MIQRRKPSRSKEKPKQALTKSQLPRRAPAVIALMEMGVNDYGEIAYATGLTVADVKEIDAAEDRKIRRLATQGTPAGTYLPLNKPVRCPTCNGMVTMAPCVACDRRWDETSVEAPVN
ncbi:MAG: hypothetical protein DWQ31_14265 [Planctomycetota bacterium]|nr:MAG: hypothetical protein DWQ31_14265 [Planctomycetota bacterium]REJ94533.1 MAG: hypothetical protein DWQ35_07970 [Planctomycetota bacterium]REK18605.1 MAG: hypothetical protein DWQ42_19500 [Planctomycetota bacterium]REK37501.1 MAG: hypothetical protein DWQ46_21980 [Planctomycetota bacterium]